MTTAFRPAVLLALAATLAATPALAGDRWQHHGPWNGGHERHDWGHDCCHGGPGFAGALLGLGIGAAVGAAIGAAAGAPVYAAPPPPPPVYYQPPPAYYGPPPAVYYGN